MSFVITTLSPETVVQVSDTRLSSLADRSVMAEDLRKSLIVQGTKGQFVVGWVGLATTDEGHRTADWLFRALCDMDAVQLSPDKIVGRLAKLATDQFKGIRAKDKRCEFILAGWYDSQPFFGVLSNYLVLDVSLESDSGLRHHLPSYKESAVAMPEFQGCVERFKNSTERHYSVKVLGDGDGSKLKMGLRGLEQLMKTRAQAARISHACRQIALEAARNSSTINKNLIAVEMERTGQAQCVYYSEEGTETMLMPDTISMNGASTQMTLSATVSGDQAKVRIRGKIRKRIETGTTARVAV